MELGLELHVRASSMMACPLLDRLCRQGVRCWFEIRRVRESKGGADVEFN